MFQKPDIADFFRTDLELIIKNENPQEVIVVGIYADICVLYTASGLRILTIKSLFQKIVQ